jgi:hypothetical protein
MKYSTISIALQASNTPVKQQALLSLRTLLLDPKNVYYIVHDVKTIFSESELTQTVTEENIRQMLSERLLAMNKITHEDGTETFEAPSSGFLPSTTFAPRYSADIFQDLLDLPTDLSIVCRRLTAECIYRVVTSPEGLKHALKLNVLSKIQCFASDADAVVRYWYFRILQPCLRDARVVKRRVLESWLPRMAEEPCPIVLTAFLEAAAAQYTDLYAAIQRAPGGGSSRSAIWATDEPLEVELRSLAARVAAREGALLQTVYAEHARAEAANEDTIADRDAALADRIDYNSFGSSRDASASALAPLQQPDPIAGLPQPTRAHALALAAEAHLARPLEAIGDAELPCGGLAAASLRVLHRLSAHHREHRAWCAGPGGAMPAAMLLVRDTPYVAVRERALELVMLLTTLVPGRRALLVDGGLETLLDVVRLSVPDGSGDTTYTALLAALQALAAAAELPACRDELCTDETVEMVRGFTTHARPLIVRAAKTALTTICAKPGS